MIKRIFLLLSLLAVGLVLFSKEIRLGEEIKIKENTAISAILNNPEKFIDKKVRIEGKIVSVDKKGGHWVTVKGEKDEQKMTVLLKGHRFHFPDTVVGSFAIFEGTVYKIELTKQQVIKWKKRLAEKNNQKFDPSTVKEGVTLYRLDPSGCIIKELTGKS